MPSEDCKKFDAVRLVGGPLDGQSRPMMTTVFDEWLERPGHRLPSGLYYIENFCLCKGEEKAEDWTYAVYFYRHESLRFAEALSQLFGSPVFTRAEVNGIVADMKEKFADEGAEPPK